MTLRSASTCAAGIITGGLLLCIEQKTDITDTTTPEQPLIPSQHRPISSTGFVPHGSKSVLNPLPLIPLFSEGLTTLNLKLDIISKEKSRFKSKITQITISQHQHISRRFRRFRLNIIKLGRSEVKPTINLVKPDSLTLKSLISPKSTKVNQPQQLKVIIPLERCLLLTSRDLAMLMD